MQVEMAERAAGHMPSTTPIPPPISASITLSVIICRISRERRAPNAVRMAISRSRAVARTSTRLATFTQASSSTMRPAPERARNNEHGVRIAGIDAQLRLGKGLNAELLFDIRVQAVISCATRLSAAFACFMLTPAGAARKRGNPGLPILHGVTGVPPMGSPTGADTQPIEKGLHAAEALGATPIMVKGCPSSVTGRPTTLGSPLNFCFQ